MCPCKLVFPLKNSVYPEKQSLIFYNDEFGWDTIPGRQVHLVEISPYSPKKIHDRIKLSKKFDEWRQFTTFIEGVRDQLPDQITLTRIPDRDPVEYFTHRCTPRFRQVTGLNIQADDHIGYATLHLTFAVIDEILSLKNRINELFQNGCEKGNCNCVKFTMRNFSGDCLMRVEDLENPKLRCKECTKMDICCKTDFRIHPYYMWDYGYNPEPMVLRSGRRIKRPPLPNLEQYMF